MTKKYVLKHFLFVGILGGFLLAQILTAIINNRIGIFLYRNAPSPLGQPVNDAILTLTSFLIILFSVYVANLLFAKITGTNSIPEEEIKRSALFFAIFVFIFITINNRIPMMLNAYFGCLSSACQAANPAVTTIPSYFLMYLFRIIAIPLGFLFVSRKYFA